MATQLEIVFYGRQEPRILPIQGESYSHLLDALKRLSMNQTDIPAYFVLGVNENVSALVAVKPIQAVRCIEGGDGTLADKEKAEGIEFYLKDRERPLSIDLDPKGPISDLLIALAETDYGDPYEGCVMMPDSEGNPFLFVPNDIEYLMLEKRYLDGIGLSPA